MGYLNNIRLWWANAWGLDIFLLRWNFLCNGIGYNGIWSPFISLTHSPSGGFDSLAPSAAVCPAESKEPNMPLICDPKLSNGALLINPRSLWLTTCLSAIHGLPQSAFPRCLSKYLADLPLNPLSLFRHNFAFIPHYGWRTVPFWSSCPWLAWLPHLSGQGSSQLEEDANKPDIIVFVFVF